MVKIICEGKTDKNKIIELLEFLDISYSDDYFIIMGNKSNFFKLDNSKYKTLQQLIKADKIDKILFIIDADYHEDNKEYGGYRNTKEKIEQLLLDLNIEKISDYYITCNPNTQDGYLESLLLSTVDNNLKQCYNEFLDCIDFKEKNQHKYIMEQLHKITQPNKPYNFNHKNFRELREKLIKLFQIDKE